MPYTIQTFYPDAGLFLNTNHVSEDLDELIQLAESDTFAGFRLQIVDDGGQVVHEPAFRERTDTPSVEDIASMFGVPLLDPNELYDGDDEDD